MISACIVSFNSRSKMAGALDSLKNSRLPVMLVHGTKDDFVPCEMTKEAYAACTSQKEIFLVENAGHGTSYLFDTPGYRKRVMAFLRKYVNEDI